MSRWLLPFYFIRMVLFYVGFIFTTLFFGIVVALLSIPFSHKIRFYTIIYGWCSTVLFWMRLVCGVRYEVVGKEHLQGGAAVIFSKHSSRWETIALPVILIAPVLVVKKEFLRWPLIGWGASLCQFISIDRSRGSQALKDLVEQGKIYLAKGRQIMMFPEGTRKGNGYKKGGIVLARSAGFPIIPVAHNAHECWPDRQIGLTPGTIKVIIGPPIDVKGKTTSKLLDEASGWIEAQVEKISTRPASPPSPSNP